MFPAVWNAMGTEKKMMINKNKPGSKRFGIFFQDTNDKLETLASGFIQPDENRCVQCGICSYNCPIDLDVRSYAFRGLVIQENKCLTCGECVRRCPRGVLRFVYNE
jgi:ferredoxin